MIAILLSLAISITTGPELVCKPPVNGVAQCHLKDKPDVKLQCVAKGNQTICM